MSVAPDAEKDGIPVYEILWRGQVWVRLQGRKCGHVWMGLTPTTTNEVIKRYCATCKSVRRVDVVVPPSLSSDGRRRCSDPECGVEGGALLNRWNKDNVCGACRHRVISARFASDRKTA